MAKKDQMVDSLSPLPNSLLDSCLSTLVDKETQKEAWNALIKKYAIKSRSQIIELEAKLYNTRKQMTNLDEDIQDLGTIVDDLAASMHIFNETDLIHILLNGLG